VHILQIEGSQCSDVSCRLLSDGKAAVALSWLQRAVAIDARNHIAWMLLCKCVESHVLMPTLSPSCDQLYSDVK
jgi:hypothetical protein